MFQKLILLLFIITLLPITISAQAKVQGKQIAFTTPDVPWILTLTLDGFTLDKQQTNPQGGRYFMLVNNTTNVIASLFMEPAKKCKTAKECRDMVFKAGNPGWEKPTGLVQSDIGAASAFEFLIPSFRGQPVRQYNLYAEFVRDGYWVDLHISKTLYTKTDHILFEDIVKSAKFESKAATTIEAATAAATDWLALWDEGKTDAVYEKLAASAQKQMSKQIWATYWNAVRKPLGKLKTRKLVETEYIPSLPGIPDQEGYIIRYDSSFENSASVSETVALIREKDGSWRVGHYLSNYEPGKTGR